MGFFYETESETWAGLGQLGSLKLICYNLYTVFPHIVSAETILF